MTDDDRGPGDRERLDSWKAIAAYLGRGLRTVQRWEREEGLPVHRHLHTRQASVHALRSELDTWRRGRERAPEVPAVPALVLLLSALLSRGSTADSAAA